MRNESDSIVTAQDNPGPPITTVQDLPGSWIGALSGNTELTILFGTFVFLQFTVLGLANHAGEGYLSTGWRELVYYALQVFVILGYLGHSMAVRFCTGERFRSAAAYTVSGLFLACTAVMLTADSGSPFYVAISMTAALCLGGIGGAVHVRMSMETVKGAAAAQCMGFGSAAAVVLQYLLQIRWGVTPLLPVFMLAGFLLLLSLLLRRFPEAAAQGDSKPEHTPAGRIAFAILIAAAFILFSCFYNEHIHHLQIRSGYEGYNVYSWPRLMLVPGYLLFAAIGDRKKGKYVPLTALCIMLFMLLNVVLIGIQGAYWLNMCLFYFSIAAFTSYYLLTFWRLAPGTRNPALWAPFGRIMDSGMVLLTGAVHLSDLPAPVVLGADIAGAVAVILLMTASGDFTLASSKEAQPEVPADERPTLLSPEETLGRMRETYSLTPREMEVLQKLLLTEDELQPIADSLYISRRVLSRHITAIYQKTGTKSRVGLYQLYHAASQEN